MANGGTRATTRLDLANEQLALYKTNFALAQKRVDDTQQLYADTCVELEQAKAREQKLVEALEYYAENGYDTGDKARDALGVAE